MFDKRGWLRGAAAGSMLVSLLETSRVQAQTAPPAPPEAPASAPTMATPAPPGYAPPPPGYMYVPLPQAGTSVSPPLRAVSRPAELPYRAGEPLPVGYHLEESPRSGLVTAGYIVSAIPYGISALIAISSDFQNATSYLLLPYVGPWLTIGRRNYHDCSRKDSASASGSTSGEVSGDASSSNDLGCVADVLVVTGLALDGLVQVTGGTLLLTGYLTTKTRVLRDDMRLSLRPTINRSALGLSVTGAF